MDSSVEAEKFIYLCASYIHQKNSVYMTAYSQFRAFKALTLASFKSILKSPSSVIFTIAFPLVFIIAFGWIGNENAFKEFKIGVKSNFPDIKKQFEEKEYFQVIPLSFEENEDSFFVKNKADAIIVEKEKNVYEFIFSDNNKEKNAVLHDLFLSQIQKDSSLIHQYIISEKITENSQKISKKIDYILPGQLGFSLLAASVFGTAFVFFSLRNGQVLKRFFATPVRAITILLAEGTSRLVFQLFGSIILLMIGVLVFDFTIPSGIATIIGISIWCVFGIISFMSFGFIISGLAKSESTVPPLANIIVLPQFILSDTFIPIEDLPQVIQIISKALPLTHFNQALRLFSQYEFTQIPFSTLGMHFLVILAWGIIGYLIAGKTFKWE